MNHPQTSQTHMTVAIAALLCGAREYTLRGAISRGDLQATVQGDGTLTVDMHDLEAWRESLPQTGGFR